jgi:hypothetical protein
LPEKDTITKKTALIRQPFCLIMKVKMLYNVQAHQGGADEPIVWFNVVVTATANTCKPGI